jgi:hypothetical protein
MAEVSDPSGWRPLQKPNRAAASIALGPFSRLARLHALGAAADGLITVALAGSIFFSIEPDAARWRVALYLLLTIAPFAVVTPFLGPVIDRTRGGRRGMIIGSTFARAIVAFLMVANIESILLFPLAFALLVLQKTYSVAKSAVVPKLVGNEHRLVEANSKLALLSAIGGMAGAAVGALASLIAGPEAAATIAVFVYLAAGIAGIQLPSIVVADAPAAALERAELRGSGIVLAAGGMGVLRGIVGFMTFLLAFELRGGKDGVDVKPEGAAAGAATAVSRGVDIVGDPGAPAWHFGVVVAAAGIGALLGARLAPWMRQRIHEERILLGVFGATAVAAFAAAMFGALTGAMLLSLAVALGAGAGKLAFDSLVQRDAPDANYGRSFARFEARFQLTWVIGAFLPVVLPLPARVGYVLVAIAAGFATVTYFLGTRRLIEAPIAPSGDDEIDQFGAVDPTAVIERPGDPTLVFGAPAYEKPVTGDDTSREVGEVVDHEVEQVTDEVIDAWTAAPIPPVVSSVEGVEVDPDVGGSASRVSPRRPDGT